MMAWDGKNKYFFFTGITLYMRKDTCKDAFYHAINEVVSCINLGTEYWNALNKSWSISSCLKLVLMYLIILILNKIMRIDFCRLGSIKCFETLFSSFNFERIHKKITILEAEGRNIILTILNNTCWHFKT